MTITISLTYIIITSAIIVLYFPIAVAQTTLLLAQLRKNSDRVHSKFKKSKIPMPPPILMQKNYHNGRKIAVVITTNGANAEVVDKLLSILRSYMLPIRLFVIKEEYDTHKYPAEEIIVPKDYRCPNGSRAKLRALHYGSLWFKEHGFGKETYICHLDDDSVVSREYLEYVYSMSYDSGQGHIRLREAGKHLFSTLGDMWRVSECASFCAYFNSKGKPMTAHGEGMVIRADVEEKIGWDYGTYGAEDVIMAQLIVKNGYTFGYIPGPIFIAPPLSAKDFYKQRRRWIWAMLWATPFIEKINRKYVYWALYRYAIGWTGFVGFFLSLPAYFIHFQYSYAIIAFSMFNTINYFFFYQYGIFKTNKKWSLLMFILQYPVSLYEGGTMIYSLLFPPNKMKYDVIKKV